MTLVINGSVERYDYKGVGLESRNFSNASHLTDETFQFNIMSKLVFLWEK